MTEVAIQIEYYRPLLAHGLKFIAIANPINTVYQVFSQLYRSPRTKGILNEIIPFLVYTAIHHLDWLL